LAIGELSLDTNGFVLTPHETAEYFAVVADSDGLLDIFRTGGELRPADHRHS
jgi:hypothetical protein